ncbi:MAG: hypothetical protein QOG49_151 [Frankiaceae bacterium]|nr:hypothetical protein [Frankiaceae bacterium]
MDPARLSDALSAAAHTLAVDQVTAEVVTALRARDIEGLLLKGPTFAHWLYPSETLRPYADTDLLVAPRDQDAAAGVLESLGFADPMATALAHERDDHSRTYHRSVDGAADAEVDLHFTLAGCRATAEVVWSALARDAVPFEVAGTQVTALSVTARALVVVLHAAHDGGASGRPAEDLDRALALTDLPEWRKAAALAAKVDALAAFAAGLGRTAAGRDLLDALGVAPAANTYEVLRASTPPPMSLGIARLLDRPDARGLGRELLREIVPTRAFMRVWSPMARRGRAGLLAAYVWRPFSLVIRLGPAARAYLRARRRSGRWRG